MIISVPCLRRAASIEEEYEAAGGEVLLDNEDNDGWLATHGKPKGMFLLPHWSYFETGIYCMRIWVTSLTLCYVFPPETKCDEEENLPSIETLDIHRNNTIQSISSYFGGEEEEDIPDMAEYEEPDNLVETDSVSC